MLEVNRSSRHYRLYERNCRRRKITLDGERQETRCHYCHVVAREFLLTPLVLPNSRFVLSRLIVAGLIIWFLVASSWETKLIVVLLVPATAAMYGLCYLGACIQARWQAKHPFKPYVEPEPLPPSPLLRRLLGYAMIVITCIVVAIYIRAWIAEPGETLMAHLWFAAALAGVVAVLAAVHFGSAFLLKKETQDSVALFRGYLKDRKRRICPLIKFK